MTHQNAWPEIQTQLVNNHAADLQHLLAASQLGFDGAYTISAAPSVYAQLCAYYPVIETVVQDISGKHLRLALDKSVPMGTDSDSITLSMGAANITEAIISPEQIVAIPAYLLRFVPFYGASAVLIAAALRQASFLTSRERGGSTLFPEFSDTVTINVEALLNTLGHVISRATFFRIFKDGGMDWFVQRDEPVHRMKAGRITRQANTYIYNGMLLAPGDGADLYSWLESHADRDNPYNALSEAISTPRDKILQFPYSVPGYNRHGYFTQVHSVHAIARLAFDMKNLTAPMAFLCDRLSRHLIRPESFLAVPWYWFRKVLPELGPDLGMLYLMSKSCCYIDWARGKDRNSFWVPGGQSTLQAWIGSETLPMRIPTDKPNGRGRPREEKIKQDSAYTRKWREEKRQMAGQYLRRKASRESGYGTDWQLTVEEVQLTADDAILRDSIYAFLLQPADVLDPQLLQTFAQSNDFAALLAKAAAQEADRICHFETLVSTGICHFDTLNELEICQFDTLVDNLNCYFETLVSSGICHYDTILKILNKIKYSNFFDINTVPSQISLNTDQEEAQSGLVGYFSADTWNYARILGQINPLLRDKITQQTGEQRFLAWLVFAALSASIHTPLNLAVSRTLEGDREIGGPAVRLAALPAQDLAQLLWSSIQRIQAGYLGSRYQKLPGSDDLDALLINESDQSTRQRLMQRLADALGISSAG